MKEVVESDCREGREGEHREHEDDVFRASAFKGRKEAWTTAESDGIDKDCESKQDDDLGDLKLGIEGTKAKADKEDCGDTKASSCDADTTEQVPKRRDDEEKE